MKSMDPEKLKEMAKSSGMDINTDQMAQAMNAMENLKPEQMESMMKWATRLQKCMAFCAKPYALFKWTVSTATLASLTLQRASDALGSASEIDRSRLLALLAPLLRAAAAESAVACAGGLDPCGVPAADDDRVGLGLPLLALPRRQPSPRARALPRKLSTDGRRDRWGGRF